MIDLLHGARPDERFHLQTGPPFVISAFDWGWLRRTHWACAPGSFTSWWLFGHLQWYHGTKCDYTRTIMAWEGQLGETIPRTQYVMTTTKSEMMALRWRKNGPGEVLVSNMGGS